MRIYLSCLQSTIVHPIPAYQFWQFYFKKGIEEAGHEWIETPEIDWAKALVCNNRFMLDEWKSETWEKVIKDIESKHTKRAIDIFLSYFYPVHVDIQAIKYIQKLGIPCVNFFCDNVREFKKVPKEYHCFDLNWVPEYKALEMYKNAKLSYLHLPMPVWVNRFNRDSTYKEIYKPTFIGSYDKQRGQLFYKVIQNYKDIELRGPGWNEKIIEKNNYKNISSKLYNQLDFIKKHSIKAYFNKIRCSFEKPIDKAIFNDFLKESVYNEEYFSVSKNAIITIGVNRYPSFYFPSNKPDTYSRLRDIEAPMLGACYLTEWTEGLDQMYEIGKEIETFTSAEELIEKIEDLLKHPNKREKLRKNGQIKALANHSIPMSLNKIKDALK
ncbi:glycosyltransferase [Rhodocytophaga aerolata]|uniref:Glycosyltransferase n=1 Tax=Rhodocytophaga aerolata TaxID=455078 RepID=A0ABT8RCG6_9BACT|nr:glycosyltransferase [Rhodocytophaga aerolata]MDO1449793.1 glycosyltransferase [Rhodocytophaga aerolata]